jgi:hypothetical protein
MRIRPDRQEHIEPPKGGRGGPPNASTEADVIRPFLVSGGITWYPPIAEGFDPGPDAVQLVTYVYVPPGNVGFLKQVRVAPYIPSVLADPWWTSGAANGAASWVEMDSASSFGAMRPSAQHGLWRTPFGWEAYIDFDDETDLTPPVWSWSLRLVRGNALANRNPNNILPFNPADPQSWYLYPNLAVPASAYAAGIPGDSPGPQFSEQRMQVLPEAPLHTHLLIPQNTTLCLFTKWSQQAIRPMARDANGRIIVSENTVLPLLPSFGQLHGYVQSLDSKQQPAASLENARHGWGG